VSQNSGDRSQNKIIALVAYYEWIFLFVIAIATALLRNDTSAFFWLLSLIFLTS